MTNVIIFSQSALFIFSLTSIIHNNMSMGVKNGNVKIEEFSSVDDFIGHLTLFENSIVIFDIDGVPKEKQNTVFNTIKRVRAHICLMVFCRYGSDSVYYRSLHQITHFIVSKKVEVKEIVATLSSLFLLVKKTKSCAFSLDTESKIRFMLSP